MKLENKTGHIQIPLSQLRVTSNVRTLFDEQEIEELAASIKENGLINAITVKPPVTDEHGNKTYEVIAGGRRIRAHQWLCEHGDDFSMIDCKIVVGDMLTLQLIENLQRSDLSNKEKEVAIRQMLDNGMTQSDIAHAVSKPLAWVSDIVAGAKVRQVAENAGIQTDGICTKALSQLRSIPNEKRVDALQKLNEAGGTVKAATEILNDYRKENESSSLEIEEEAWADEVHRYDTEIARSMGRELPEDDDENTIEPAVMTKEEFESTTPESSANCSVYCFFNLAGDLAHLDLRGKFTKEEALRKKDILKKKFPDCEWYAIDENRHDLD